MMKKVSTYSKGFTLMEVLIVIGIIAVLATIVIAAINPARQFAQARNTQRVSNITAILNAVGQRMVDNRGQFEGGSCPTIPTATTSIGTTFTACLIPTYMAAMPFDPSVSPSTSETGYEIRMQEATSRITVCAPLAAQETSLGSDAYIPCVTR